MEQTLVLAVVFVVLLMLDWRYRLTSLRLATVLIALIVLIFTAPSARRAARHAFVAPPAERVTQLHGSLVSEYESGVLTMERAVVADKQMFSNENLLALAVLVWLACTPSLRRSRAAYEEPISPRRRRAV